MIKLWGNRAYHRGFDDARYGRPYNPPRFFRRAYQFGYEWQQATALPPIEQFTGTSVAECKERRDAFFRRWFPDMVLPVRKGST